jgi:hypothetical protein
MRAAGAKSLSDYCTIQRQSSTSEDGYLSGDWSNVATNVACRVLPETRSDQRGIVEDREANRTYFRLALAHTANLRAGDRVVLAGVVNEVLQITSPITDQVFTMAKLARID